MHHLLKGSALLVILLFSHLCVAGDDPVWIDVRTPAEFREGHVEGSTLIPYDRIESGIERLSLDKDATIYLYCGSGRRSGFAQERLRFRGYTNVTNVGSLEQARALHRQQAE